jgi:hypothetical protein
VAVAVVAGEEDAGGKMKSRSTDQGTMYRLILAFVISALVCVSSEGATKTTLSQPKQKEFNTPKEAADNLVQAAAAFNVAALKEILGPDSSDIVSSEDPVTDKNRAAAFATKAKEKMLLGTDAKNPNRVILTVGYDDFPMPIPIVRLCGGTTAVRPRKAR